MYKSHIANEDIHCQSLNCKLPGNRIKNGEKYWYSNIDDTFFCNDCWDSLKEKMTDKSNQYMDMTQINIDCEGLDAISQHDPATILPVRTNDCIDCRHYKRDNDGKLYCGFYKASFVVCKKLYCGAFSQNPKPDIYIVDGVEMNAKEYIRHLESENERMENIVGNIDDSIWQYEWDGKEYYCTKNTLNVLTELNNEGPGADEAIEDWITDNGFSLLGEVHPETYTQCECMKNGLIKEALEIKELLKEMKSGRIIKKIYDEYQVFDYRICITYGTNLLTVLRTAKAKGWTI